MTLRQRAPSLITVAALAVVVFAGCGSGDNVSSQELQQATQQAAQQARQEERLKELQQEVKALQQGQQSSGSAAAPSSSGSRTSCGEDVFAGSNTSCEFALNVAASYYQSGGQGSIDVYSPVTGRTYTMSCTSGSPHACTGGNNASVYFP